MSSAGQRNGQAYAKTRRFILVAFIPAIFFALHLPGCEGQSPDPVIDIAIGEASPVSMVQRLRRPGAGSPPPRNPPGLQSKPARFPREFRSIDGTGNNRANPQWGSTQGHFMRLCTPDYGDDVGSPAGGDRPGARQISNAVSAQSVSIPNPHNASDFLWQWGQFLDHDIDETPVADPPEPFDISVPLADPWFDPDATGLVTIPLQRSAYATVNGVREQLNLITSFIDGSNVYGSDAERVPALRSLDGTGRLRTSQGDLLPFNTLGLENAPSTAPGYFLAGDIRANEHVGLTAVHTLFLREHNFWADRIRTAAPRLHGDEVYEVARAIVIAELQSVTYREFLPVLLGPDRLRPYRGYRADVDPRISNEFATAAYRMGHSMLSTHLLRIDETGREIDAGHLPLANAYFDPTETVDHGIEAVLRGLASQVAQDVDLLVIDDVRNFLFGPPGAGGFDLAALNIQRGRDHGLPAFNQARLDLGLLPCQSFADISADPSVQAGLQSVYASVHDVDFWVGALAEQHAPGALVGETCLWLLVDQFERLRDGDRFWYREYLPNKLVKLVETQSLSRIIRRNTAIGAELPDNVFVVEPALAVAFQSSTDPDSEPLDTFDFAAFEHEIIARR